MAAAKGRVKTRVHAAAAIAEREPRIASTSKPASARWPPQGRGATIPGATDARLPEKEVDALGVALSGRSAKNQYCITVWQYTPACAGSRLPTPIRSRNEPSM